MIVVVLAAVNVATDIAIMAIVSCPGSNVLTRDQLLKVTSPPSQSSQSSVSVDQTRLASCFSSFWGFCRCPSNVGVMMWQLISPRVTIASCVRMYFYTAVKALNDWTGSMPTVIFASIFEVNLAIIVASVPMVRPLWKRFRARRQALEFKDRAQDDYISQGYSQRHQLSAHRTPDANDTDEMDLIEEGRRPAGYPKAYMASLSRPDSWPATEQYPSR
jgi:hypothetical protein